MTGFPRRLFIALPVENPGLTGVAAELSKYSRCLKIVPDINYHITLKFLGDTGRDRYEKLIAGLDSGIIPARTAYSVKGLGCFPGLARPNIIWAGMEYDRVSAESIFRFVETSAEAAGFAPETRDFKPHLTLARVKRDAHVPPGLLDYIKNNSASIFSSAVFDRILLYESVLKKTGPEYSVVREWALS